MSGQTDNGAAGQSVTLTESELAARIAAAEERAEARGLKAGCDQQRARIAAILTCEGAAIHREAAQSFALDTSMTAAEAIMVLGKMPAPVVAPAAPVATAPTPFEQAMAGIRQPNIGPDVPAGGQPGAPADEDALVSAILAFDPNRAGKRA